MGGTLGSQPAGKFSREVSQLRDAVSVKRPTCSLSWSTRRRPQIGGQSGGLDVQRTSDSSVGSVNVCVFDFHLTWLTTPFRGSTLIGGYLPCLGFIRRRPSIPFSGKASSGFVKIASAQTLFVSGSSAAMWGALGKFKSPRTKQCRSKREDNEHAPVRLLLAGACVAIGLNTAALTNEIPETRSLPFATPVWPLPQPDRRRLSPAV